ncbi:MAG: hypothetical protein HOM58_08075 [Rhodospirillaceae bacterium]|nr:hypothetical protein [Rhodospirillaceae bacterium]
MSQIRHILSHTPTGLGQIPKPLMLLERGVKAIIVAMIVLGLHRVFIANINWDEFYFLSLVHLYQNGDLTAPLQTIHVHLFGWLPLVSDNEIHQIFAARVFMWCLSLGSCWMIYDISRKFCSREAALFPVLFYLGFSYVADHVLSFRADPLCAFLFLASLHLLLGKDRSRIHMVISAIFMSAAIMVSIKSIFYLATIGPVLLTLSLMEPVKRGAELRGFVFIIAGVLASFVLFQWHSSTLTNATATEAGAAMMSAGSKTLLSGPFFPQAYFIVRALAENGIIWLFIFSGLWKAGHDAWRGDNRHRSLILLSFALPLLSLVIYRNAFPYFFVFLMPAVVILGGISADLLITRLRQSASRIPAAIFGGTLMLISASLVTSHFKKLPDQTIAQREVVAAIHGMYGEPVPYLDRNSMMSSFPKAGFYMSGWGMENYRARKSAIMEDLMRREQPRFLIANSCALNISMASNTSDATCQHRLLDRDFHILRANFVHHWGPIYVIGKTFDIGVPGVPQSFQIFVSGIYTLEAAAPVSIDGVVYQPGDRVRLDQAPHNIAATGGPTRAELRLGDRLYKPNTPPTAEPLYYRF